DAQLPLKSVITQKLYNSTLTQSLIAIPMYYEQDLFACAIFTANDSTLLNVDAMALLRIACKLLEFKLISFYYQENLRAQKNILQIAMNSLQEGIFYLDQNKQRMFCTPQLANFLKIEEQMLNRNEFWAWIREEDQSQLLAINEKIDQGEPYEAIYRLRLQNQEIHVKEQASPYISREGKIKFYVGTIRKIVENIPVSQQKMLMDDELSLQSFLEEVKAKMANLDLKFALARFQIINQDNLSSDLTLQTIKFLYEIIKQEFSNFTFYLADGTFLSYLEIADQRLLDRKIRLVLEKADRGLRYQNFNINFGTKASLVRYPRDSFNVDELLIFSELSLKTPERYQIFSDDIHKKYVKSSQVTFCLQEQLKKGDVALLYLELIAKKESLKSYLVQFNIPGLLPKESLSQFASDFVLVPFQIMALKQLMREIKPEKDFLYYFPISLKALEILHKDQYFITHQSLFLKIRLVINDYAPKLKSLIQHLHQLNMKVLINFHVFKQLNMDDVLENLIYGVLVEENLDYQLRDSLVKISKMFDYELVANFDVLEYTNVKYKSDNLENIDQINAQ
ncbi:MAG TPA: PAS domain-containing protein, partial [Bacilli bacterium]|nr:PAS domain-containing protein [Bacilli bacterium]